MISIVGKFFLSSFKASTTFLLLPWALSRMRKSTPASARALALSSFSALMPIDAPTRSLPFLSKMAFGYSSWETTVSLTILISAAWASMDMFLWMTPTPPFSAKAIAISCSVTVSIAALMRGTLILRFLLRRVLRVTMSGVISLYLGMRRTSSNVRPKPTILSSNCIKDTSFLVRKLTKVFLLKIIISSRGVRLYPFCYVSGSPLTICHPKKRNNSQRIREAQTKLKIGRIYMFFTYCSKRRQKLGFRLTCNVYFYEVALKRLSYSLAIRKSTFHRKKPLTRI